MFSFQIKKTSTMFHISDKNSKLEKKKKKELENMLLLFKQCTRLRRDISKH